MHSSRNHCGPLKNTHSGPAEKKKYSNWAAKKRQESVTVYATCLSQFFKNDCKKVQLFLCATCRFSKMPSQVLLLSCRAMFLCVNFILLSFVMFIFLFALAIQQFLWAICWINWPEFWCTEISLMFWKFNWIIFSLLCTGLFDLHMQSLVLFHS